MVLIFCPHTPYVTWRVIPKKPKGPKLSSCSLLLWLLLLRCTCKLC